MNDNLKIDIWRLTNAAYLERRVRLKNDETFAPDEVGDFVRHERSYKSEPILLKWPESVVFDKRKFYL